MRRISAHYIYPVSSPPLRNGIIEINSKGEIQSIIDTKGELTESRNLEFYNGIIVPGFINTHCHLELSELMGQFPKYKGLPEFLKNIVGYKKSEKTLQTYKAIQNYDAIMKINGIVAVGDIANTNYSIEVKKNSSIYYHTFIEAIGLNEDSIEIFNLNKNLYQEFITTKLRASIVPHSPYSVSENLFKLIREFAKGNNSILSMHNQETQGENQMFFSKTGELFDTLKVLGVDLKHWQYTRKGSLESVIDFLPATNNIILIHNTYSRKEDVKLATEKLQNVFWCLCPLSNIYIENKMPDLGIFSSSFDNITLGTDSLASNNVLSILEEMKAIINYNRFISFDKILKWGTLNGAKALMIDDKYGSIEVGKSPGLNLISHFDYKLMSITEASEVKPLLN